MSLNVFFKVVEIQTKIASVFPFLVGLLFTWQYFQMGDWLNTGLFFLAMLIFDLTTTAINNYMDFQKAVSQEYKYHENIIGQAGLSPQLVRRMILGMLAFVAVLGLILVIRTGWLLFFMGAVCCFIGIFYTFGPIPLSRMPLGEIFSGVTMGLGIPAIVVYINTHNASVFYLDIDWTSGVFELNGNLWAVATVVWASLPLMFTIANIMLANNLRDLDTDIKNHRYTLVFYIGRKRGVILFQLLMYSCYICIILGLVMGVYKLPVLLVMATFPMIKKNLQEHKRSLPQPQSFGYAIKNMILFNSVYVLALAASLLWVKFV